MMDHLRNLTRRVQNMARVGRTTVAPNDDGPIQTVQVKSSSAETTDAVKVAFHYGLTSNLPVGTDVTYLSLAGDRSNSVVIASGHQQYRVKGLPGGGVALYDMSGSVFMLDGQGGMSITPKGGTLTVNGKLVVTQDATIGGKDFLQHAHGGVQTGSGNTGAPV